MLFRSRVDGPRGLPALTRFATVVAHAIPLLWRRAPDVAGLRVQPARPADLEEMAAVWARIARGRQFAGELAAEPWREWIRRAPGLTIYDYLVARRPDGRIAGFVAVWDQRTFKQLRVLAYSARLAAARRALNALAPITGTRLPAPGGALPSLAAVHLCADDPAVLRALVLHAYAAYRGSGYLFLTLALDRRDPLARGLRGLLAQPTVVRAYATSPAGRWRGAPLDRRPLHFEAALV